MDRREFLKKLGKLGATGASAYFLSKVNPLFGASSSKKNISGPLPFDLVAIHGSTPEKMFDAGMKQFGGMKQFISKGDIVVVKPNIGFNTGPDRGATTNPKLVGRVIEHCFQAGAKKVYVFDNCVSYWQDTYKTTRIQQEAKNAGAKVVRADQERYFQKLKNKKAKVLKNVKVHELILEANKVINIPILKNHSGALMTAASKNLMGVVWDRMFYHYNNLHQCIADFGLYHKPTLNIIDAYTVMVKNGPRGYSKGDLVLKKMQIISPDIVAADAAAAKILGKKIERIAYIPKAHKMKLGNMNLNELKIKRLAL